MSNLIKIDYTNWKGERSFRIIRPTGEIEFMSNTCHRTPQWLLNAVDMDKNLFLQFAMKDIHSWEVMQ